MNLVDTNFDRFCDKYNKYSDQVLPIYRIFNDLRIKNPFNQSIYIIDGEEYEFSSYIVHTLCEGNNRLHFPIYFESNIDLSWFSFNNYCFFCFYPIYYFVYQFYRLHNTSIRCSRVDYEVCLCIYSDENIM
jgi:hypothetical protein